jgi:hypothetical protein
MSDNQDQLGLNRWQGSYRLLNGQLGCSHPFNGHQEASHPLNGRLGSEGDHLQKLRNFPKL